MKLVITYTVSDECTFWCEENLPFEYESKEKAEYDLICLWEKYYKDIDNYNTQRAAGVLNLKYSEPDINFAGLKIPVDSLTDTIKVKRSKKRETYDFIRKYAEPKIYTLDEWFEVNKPQHV